MRRWQWVSDDGKKIRKFVCIITNAEILYKTYFEAFLLKIGDVNCTGIYKYTKNIQGISIQLFLRTAHVYSLKVNTDLTKFFNIRYLFILKSPHVFSEKKCICSISSSFFNLL